jgi:glyoxylase-like metal-dependent hydrolase (beta-lactamase superfamily II)
MQFLELRGPGTAIVAFDEPNKTAYITDGGKSGDRGIEGATIDGHDLLDALLRRNVERLVITCSHPHSDHLDGLLELVRDPRMGDPRLREVHFVDSDIPAESRLFDAYQKSWPPGQIAGRVAAYHSARGVDALNALAGPESRVVARNFQYDPPEGDAHPHGQCVISMTELRRGTNQDRVVDFDDANDVLVQRWADWAKADAAARRPGVIVVPHHGSAHSDLGPLLDKSIRPRSAVVTVNPDNQYRHPGPKTLLALLQALGPENVHFTGRSANIKVDERGIAPRPDTTRLHLDYELFFEKAALDIDREILELEGRTELTADDRAKLDRLRETRKTYGELEHILTADPALEAVRKMERSALFSEWSRKIRGESYALGMAPYHGPDTPLNPYLEHDEKLARQRLESEAAGARSLSAVRKALADGQYAAAAGLAADALKQDNWTARERQALARLTAAEPLLTGREAELAQRGALATTVPGALAWPEIAGPAGAEALEVSALREARDLLASPENDSPERMRWVIDALEKSGAGRDRAARAVIDNLRFRLLLAAQVGESDVRAVDSMSPAQAAAQLQTFKAALDGPASRVTLSKNNPLMRDLQDRRPGQPAPPLDTTKLIRDIDVRLANDRGGAGRRESEAKDRDALERLVRKRVIGELDAVSDLRQKEIAVRDSLAKRAEVTLKEPLLASERLALREKTIAGTPTNRAIEEIKSARKELNRMARMWNPEYSESIQWNGKPPMTFLDIGLTPEVMAQREAKALAERNAMKYDGVGTGALGRATERDRMEEFMREQRRIEREAPRFSMRRR